MQAKSMMGLQAEKGNGKEEDDYLAFNMKFNEEEFEQLMQEAQNMGGILRGEQASPAGTWQCLASAAPIPAPCPCLYRFFCTLNKKARQQGIVVTILFQGRLVCMLLGAQMGGLPCKCSGWQNVKA